MKTRTTLALLALTLGTLPAMAQQLDANGIGRTELVRHDFDTTREAIQVRVDFGPGVAFPRHSHPGVEIAHVEQGAIEYDLDGKRVLLTTGETVYIPDGVVHSARNVGSGNAAELATYTGPGAAGRPFHIKVTLDGQPPGADHGTDIDADGNGVVTATRLYQLVRQSGKVRARRFEVRFLDRGAEAYAFTFG